MATMGTSRRSSRCSLDNGRSTARSASAMVSCGKTCGMPCLAMAIRLKALGASGSPMTSTTLTFERADLPMRSASTRSPASASPNSPIGALSRTRLSTGASHGLPAPSISTTPIRPSVRAGSFFIGCAIQPRAVSSLRARMRSPRLTAAILLLSFTTSRGGFSLLSGAQFSGSAIASPSSIATTLSTVTLGTPPMR